MANKSKIILGIDPGTLVMGYGLISITGKKVSLLDMNVEKLSKYKDHYERLQQIHNCVNSLIRQYKPTSFAIEAPFYGKNVQSMLKLGRAQGVAIAAAIHNGLTVTEYSPKKVKQSVTGNGNADKEQVWLMLQRILQITGKPDYFDATDALAVAVCHHYQECNPLAGISKSKGWEQFIQQHPERIVR
ncbi:Holliday junction endonuclease RuvC [Chitinophaga terrae (ex Kim and Jung 2007)]|uniref:Crossover junction endodeoxyribonuclease RuvC n=1 Tax=Chitinophaga terrae (ex Kim and Jung 2007) TaxID=408074 RepID=A0A1H3Y4W1_9BACT|nr:crossover junction endodeoxyribonuclease RuvC [Chitinophaga terrae (ex Kim and Jung 2007)]MDQ0108003.1 crossover junction endodeoxyribonuclease RuvC [Chitinophaga terrae (ex Kim and Jung 2007)]SEA06679.1 Holliday junction endonuclease RuvC [Chitinophaga terrae (ex Kim and Jung 2007)]